ncbi:MAG: tRNA lysidine(34) synthetase TilS [Acidobacteria bacterium]|jgi:tRNA(Ile)-lysidine synthase TilS/MesJ|nr:tRNA lysidine(34) synthetase TilS [Acidobacteriota bacterium]
MPPGSLIPFAPPSLLHELTRPWAPEPGARVLVAVSGGGDSVALLHLLAALAPGRGWALAVATLDHGLRGEESAADRRFVEELAASLGVPCRAGEAGLPDGSDPPGPTDPPGPAPPLAPAPRTAPPSEAALRSLRRSFLAAAADAHGAVCIALGHTLDDQAETVLQRLARGAGLAGARAMARWAPPFWRPLLGVRRAELRRLLEAAGHAWREDASNREPHAARNRLRLGTLPALEQALGPAAIENLARAAELARDDEELLDTLAAAEEARIVTARRPDAATLDRRALAALAPALARRVVRRALAALDPEQPGEAAHVHAVLALARADGPGTEAHLPRGLVARREGGRVILSRPPSAQDTP